MAVLAQTFYLSTTGVSSREKQRYNFFDIYFRSGDIGHIIGQIADEFGTL